MNFISELWDHSYFFFQQPESYDVKTVQKVWKEDTPDLMLNARSVIQTTTPFAAGHLEENMKGFVEAHGVGFGRVMNPLRLLLVGAAMGPHLFDIMEIIGKEETLARIDRGLKNIPS